MSKFRVTIVTGESVSTEDVDYWQSTYGALYLEKDDRQILIPNHAFNQFISEELDD